jgi:hypothetical protein
LSEIHINDALEVSVVSSDEPQLVVLGSADIGQRWLSYLREKPEIDRMFPQAFRVDMRFKDQTVVTVNPGQEEERMAWRAERNSL